MGLVPTDTVVKQRRELASDLPSDGMISGVVLNFAERPSKDAAPSLYRIFSINSELEVLSSLTSSVSFKIKFGSCSRLSRLFFLTGANGTPGSVIKGHKIKMQSFDKTHSGLWPSSQVHK
jgi:hypothetical protein